MASDQPPSLNTSPSGEDTGTVEPALVRLHGALKGLDGALHEALVALDVALGRPVRSAPEDALPYRELGRLRLHLEAAVREPSAATPERNFQDMALDWSDGQAGPEGEAGGDGD